MSAQAELDSLINAIHSWDVSSSNDSARNDSSVMAIPTVPERVLSPESQQAICMQTVCYVIM